MDTEESDYDLKTTAEVVMGVTRKVTRSIEMKAPMDEVLKA